MKSVFCAGAGIQSVLFFLNGGYLPAGRELSPRTRIGPFHRPPYCLRQQGPTPADGPQRNCQPFCGFRFYFLIFCKCFMPSSKRLRKASTSSGVLSAQKDTRMAVSMASGSRPMAASVWLG